MLWETARIEGCMKSEVDLGREFQEQVMLFNAH